MPIIRLTYQLKNVSKEDVFQIAKDCMKKVIQHRFKHHGFGLYAKYDFQNDLITMWLTQPADGDRLIENILDGQMNLRFNKEDGFQLENGDFLNKKELAEAIKHWPISVTGPLSQEDVSDCFDMIDNRFEQFEEQAKQDL
jgi:hypothetical protein